MSVLMFLSSLAMAITVQEATDAALSLSPSTDLSVARLSEADARVRGTTAYFLPSVNASAGFLAQNEVTFNISDQLPEIPLLDPDDFEDMIVAPGTQWQATAQLSQPLVVPQAWAGRKAAIKARDMTHELAEADKVAVLRAVILAFHASAQTHAMLEEARRGEEMARTLLAKGEAMVEHGVAAPDEILPFRRALATTQSNVALAEEATKTADGVLATLTGIEGSADALELPEKLPSLDDLLEELSRPDFQLAQSRIEAAQAMRAVEGSARWPILAANAGLTVLTPEPAFGDVVNWRVMVGVQVPLFRGGAVQAKVKEASARVEQARAGERAVQQMAEIEVRRAHGDLARAMSALKAQEEAADLADQAVEAAEKRMGKGAGSLLALEQAQAVQIGARAQLTLARSNAVRAVDLLALAVKGTI
ncbi:MAG: TolC family protein [Proteobacteria bacterium]|jgi:outer membrane protein TolC|nr:TolC family protein [Pseudomonadota bacterium]